MSAIGQELGNRYRIEALVGAGGMATVYRARDLRLDRAVAVKVLSPNLATDKTVARRFEQEARFLAAVSHPSIVSVYDVGEADGEPFFVMELVDGETLTDRLARGGPLEADEVVRILSDIAEGLLVLHRGGFVHRDVKPQNILLPREGRAKLADFGLVRDDRASDLTAPGTAVGTLAYLAPELLRGESATPATDVYSLSAVAYEAFTGRAPYPVDTIVALVEGQAEPPPLPSSVAPWLTTSFDRPLLDGLAARKRPSVEAFAASLRAGETSWREAGAPRPGSVSAAVFNGRTSPNTAAGAFGAGGALATGAAGVFAAGAADSTALTRAHVARRTAGEDDVSRTPLVAWLLAIVGALVGVALMVAFLGALGSPSPGTGVGPTPTRPSPTPSATPTARLGTNPVAGVAQAVEQFQQAVAAAQGGKDGLKGKEANELNNDAQRVADAAREGDTEKARERAADLVNRVERLSRDIRSDDAARLRVAAKRVEQAAAALPEED
jgi:eukaryotic-like serine/threonine-protein kinase